MGGRDPSRCRVRGEVLVEDFYSNREVGQVCRHCEPAYFAALDIANYELLHGPKLRKRVAALLRSLEFVNEAIVSAARDRILTDIELALNDPSSWSEFVEYLAKYFTRGFDIHQLTLDDCSEVEYSGLRLHTALWCMSEEKRTMKYVQALWHYLNDLEFLDRDIEIVDAGCGPVPLFGLLAALKSDKVRVTCLEINPTSATMASQLVKNLGLEGRVQVFECDATAYKHEQPIDLLISETMHTGLTTEPMVQILENLTPQVVDGGVVIPSKVVVEAALIPVQSIRTHEQIVQIFFPVGRFEYTPGTFDVNRKLGFELSCENTGLQELAVATFVHLGRGVTMHGKDSVITEVQILGGPFVVSDGIGSVRVEYVPGCASDEIEVSFSAA